MRRVVVWISAVISLIVLATYIFAMQNTLPRRNESLSFKSPVAAYDWKAIDSSPDQLKTNSEEAQAKNISKIYIDVSRFADLYDSSRPDLNKIAQMENKILAIVKTYQSKNIKVATVTGNPTWYQEDLIYINKLIGNALEKYNKNHPDARIDEIHYDIEPYNLKDKNSIDGELWGKYIAMVQDITSNSSKEFKVGFLIPFWIDCTNTKIEVNTNNKTYPCPLDALLDIATNNPNNNTFYILMAYRNKAKGIDSVENTSKEFLSKSSSLNIQAMIAQEVTNVTPEKITYFSKTNSELEDSISQIQGFNGVKQIVINDLESLLDR